MRLHEKVIAAHSHAVEEYSELSAALEALGDLRAYLASPKFRNDPTVQVQDVLTRLQPLGSALIGADHANGQLRDLTRATAHAA